MSRSTITLCGRNEKNDDREFSWAWRIFVPVVIVVIGLKLLLAGVFGNKPDRMCYILVVGMAMAILFSRNASSGGLDIVAKIINKYLKIDLGKAISFSGIAVALTSAFCYDTKIVVLSVLGTYFGGMVVDHFIFGLNIKRRVCVISPKLDEIVDFILHDLHSGATLNEIIGAYDNTPRKEVITIVDKHEYRKLMDFVRKTDSKAFVTVYSVNEMRYQPKIKK